MNAVNGPKARLTYAYGPPACGNARLNCANTTASSMAPQAVRPQAITLLSPNGASEAGSRNTLAPIVFPTTRATHIQKPSSCGRLSAFTRDLSRNYSRTKSIIVHEGRIG